MEIPKKERKEIVYLVKPKRDNKQEQEEVKKMVICNLMQINFDQSLVKQYAIHFEPEIAEDNYPLKRKIIREIKPELQKYFEKYMQAGDTLFVSGKNLPEKIILKINIEEISYKIQFDLTKNEIICRNINKKCKDSLKIKNLLETLIKHIFYSNNHIVKLSDRSFYDYFGTKKLEQNGKGTICYGYSTAVCITEKGLFLRINDKNKIITGKTAYDKIYELALKYDGDIILLDCQKKIKDYFIGKTVFTQFGNYRTYRIGEVDIDKNVNNTTINYSDSDGKVKTITLNMKISLYLLKKVLLKLLIIKRDF